jgi:sec-independent protein translocase protein TatA
MIFTSLPLFFGINGSEWLIILIIVLLLFGGKKIPELMRGLGKGVKSFKDGVEDAKRELNSPSVSKDKDEDKKA